MTAASRFLYPLHGNANMEVQCSFSFIPHYMVYTGGSDMQGGLCSIHTIMGTVPCMDRMYTYGSINICFIEKEGQKVKHQTDSLAFEEVCCQGFL